MERKYQKPDHPVIVVKMADKDGKYETSGNSICQTEVSFLSENLFSTVAS